MADAQITSRLMRTSAGPQLLAKRDLGFKILARDSPYVAYGLIEFGINKSRP